MKGTRMNQSSATAILDFWFTELSPQAWFTKDNALDERIRSRFLGIYDHLANTALIAPLLAPPDTTLAALIALDQFPRNMFRGSARMFDSDAKALDLARRALDAGTDRQVATARRLFFYLPFEHSEALTDQDLSVALFEQLGDPHYRRYAIAHRDIIARFGRFPHRNEILKRPSTAEELAFLAQPGSSF